jgi:hypothetical protein
MPESTLSSKTITSQSPNHTMSPVSVTIDSKPANRGTKHKINGDSKPTTSTDKVYPDVSETTTENNEVERPNALKR